ncbi:hypothetical protein LguiB_008678 [Lonicera macranthoides]
MVDACVGVSSQVNCQRIYMIIYAKMKTITSRDHRSVDLLLQINAIYAGAAKIYSTPPPHPFSFFNGRSWRLLMLPGCFHFF